MNIYDRYIMNRAAKLLEKRNASATESTSVVNATTETLDNLLRATKEPYGIFNIDAALRLSATYACVEIISNGVAMLPLHPYKMTGEGKILASDDSTFELLAFQPNERMTRYQFLDLLVKSMLLWGNGYAKIVRGIGGVAKALYFIHPMDVVVFIVDGKNGKEIDHYYNVRTGEVIEPNDMIHLLNFTLDGVEGISTIKYAAYALGIADAANRHASNFYHSGGALTGIISAVDTRLNEKKRDEIRKQWHTQVANDSIAVLDGDMRYQPITVNPEDSQLLETRKFSVVDICRFFKVSPVKVFDLTNSSYNTVEAVNIAHLTDTLTPYLEQIELEFRMKIYPPGKRKCMVLDFDTRNATRADSTAQANLYRTLHAIGAVTPNEVREAFALSPIEGGDKAFTQVNMQTLEQFDNHNNNSDTDDGKE